MYNWLGNQVGFNVANFLLLIVGLVLVVIAIVIVISIIRRLTSGTYIAGGKDRQPRLSIQDALPVDKMRQIVLISRDNVEHLVMIGGPNDLVIETNIRKNNIAESSQRIEPQMKIDDIPQNRNHQGAQIQNTQFQNTQAIHEEPNFSSTIPSPGMPHENNMREQTMSENHSSDIVPETTNTLDTALEAPTPTRLHPTYPLKQVSAGIYTGRNPRPLDASQADVDNISSMRIENPYRREPQEQNASSKNEPVRKVEPGFSNEPSNQTMEFPANILKNPNSDSK